jgi:hypothetical protein
MIGMKRLPNHLTSMPVRTQEGRTLEAAAIQLKVHIQSIQCHAAVHLQRGLACVTVPWSLPATKTLQRHEVDEANSSTY